MHPNQRDDAPASRVDSDELLHEELTIPPEVVAAMETAHEAVAKI